jgi:hypothetical protein
MRNMHEILGGKPGRNRRLGRNSCRYDSNVKMELKETKDSL